MLKIYKHPLLINPTRWLDVPKKQSAKLYVQNYDIESNPFALALAKLESYPSNLTLPIGLGLKLEVKEMTLGKHIIVPKLWFDKVTGPTSFIINNRESISKLIKSGKSPYNNLSIKAKALYHKNSVKFMDGFVEQVDNLYLYQIKRLIDNVDHDDHGANGLHLNNSTTQLELGIINRTNISEQDLFIDFKKHPKLAKLLVSYMDYLKVS